MSRQDVTIVTCDECGQDEILTVYDKEYGHSWTQVGEEDYCHECAKDNDLIRSDQMSEKRMMLDVCPICKRTFGICVHTWEEIRRKRIKDAKKAKIT